jgi:7-cyano-7-deazaguanine synthase
MKSAVILLSGGLDSATVLAMARADGFTCHTLSLDYNQRHRSELDAAAELSRALGASTHSVVKLDLSLFGGSALTDASISVPVDGAGATASADAEAGNIPVTYVPARNTIMLSLALAKAETMGANDIFFGANAVDYSGYPDCRPEYVAAYEAMANRATRAAVEGAHMTIHTPIIMLSKGDIILRGHALGVDYARTVSCYQADAQGHACGVCDACRIRRAGFAAAQIADPTRYAA